jgi:PEGA domain-containing protein
VYDSVPKKKRNLAEETVQPSSREEGQGEESVRSGLSELAELARRALEEKRRKDCLALTNAILKIDPENKDAHVMQSWIHSDLQREIQQAYTLMRSARFSDAPEPVERAGEILEDVLDVDPANQDAQILISRVDAMLRGIPRVPVEPTPAPKPKPKPEPLPVTRPPVEIDDEDDEFEERRQPKGLRYAFLLICMVLLGAGMVVWSTGVNEWRDLLGVNVTFNAPAGTLAITVDSGIRIHINDKYVGTAPIPNLNLKPGVYHVRYEFDGVDVGSEDVTVTSRETVTNSSHAILGRLELLVIPATGVQVRIDGRPAIPVPEFVDVKAGKHRLTFTAKGFEPQTVSASVVAGDRSNIKAVLMPAVPPPSKEPASVSTSNTSNTSNTSRSNTSRSNTSPSNSGVKQIQVGPNGFLAISSPFPVDVYMDGKRVGSTPATVELPPGPHSVEYRYNGLSKTMVHVIESNQTTRASVTFN